MDVAVTGAHGFIGRNLLEVLKHSTEHRVLAIGRADSQATVEERLSRANLVVHLAGVNRPMDETGFQSGNPGLTAQYCDVLTSSGRSTPVIFSSSIQAGLDNPYGRSKKEAELRLAEYARATGAPVGIARLPNVFGPLGRPFYNSVAATFAYLISHRRPITIDDASRELELVYVADVVRAIVVEIGQSAPPGVRWLEFGPRFRLNVGRLADVLESIRSSPDRPEIDVDPGLLSRLQATYRWYASLSEDLHA